jgi:hypothetical protein
VSYLQTILTYNIPSEAEVDKAFLESHGITACLLNANTSRNELGAPFFVRLQVMDEDAGRARDLIREVNPSRFGSSERVDEIDRQIRRSIVRFALIAVPVGIMACLLTFLLVPDPGQTLATIVRRRLVAYDLRVELAVAAGIAACVATSFWAGRRR